MDLNGNINPEPDYTGTSPRHRILDEVILVDAIIGNGAVLSKGAFYTDSLIIHDSHGRVLQHMIDFEWKVMDVSSTGHSGQSVYGLLYFLKPQLIDLKVTYQYVGGEYLNQHESLIRLLENPDLDTLNSIFYSQLLNRPTTFEVTTTHQHRARDVTEKDNEVAAIMAIDDSIRRLTDSLTFSDQGVLATWLVSQIGLMDEKKQDINDIALETTVKSIVPAINELFGKHNLHINKLDNPHRVTKTQVGLGKLNNWYASSSVSTNSESTYATSAAVFAVAKALGGYLPLVGGKLLGDLDIDSATHKSQLSITAGPLQGESILYLGNRAESEEVKRGYYFSYNNSNSSELLGQKVQDLALVYKNGRSNFLISHIDRESKSVIYRNNPKVHVRGINHRVLHEGDYDTLLESAGIPNVPNWGTVVPDGSDGSTTFASKYDLSKYLPLLGGVVKGDVEFSTTMGKTNVEIISGPADGHARIYLGSHNPTAKHPRHGYHIGHIGIGNLDTDGAHELDLTFVRWNGSARKLMSYIDYTTGRWVFTEDPQVKYGDALHKVYHEGHVPSLAELGIPNVPNWGTEVPPNNNGSTTFASKYDLSKYLPLTGGNITGELYTSQNIRMSLNKGMHWGGNSDGAGIAFHNQGNQDTESRLEFYTYDDRNEFFRWSHWFHANGANSFETWMELKLGVLTVGGHEVFHEGNYPDLIGSGMGDDGISNLSSGPLRLIDIMAISGRECASNCDFSQGGYFWGVYNNNNDIVGNPVIMSIGDQLVGHNTSGKYAEISYDSSIGVAYSVGIVQLLNVTHGSQYVIRIKAKIPVGWKLNVTGNRIGDYGTDTLIGNNKGTGKWEWYTRCIKVGLVGLIDTTGHYYITKLDGTISSITFRVCDYTCREVSSPIPSNTLPSMGRLAPLVTTRGRPDLSGISMYEIYSNGGPGSYGNVLSMRGVGATGATELFNAWDAEAGGGESTAGTLYHRAARDTMDQNFSPWNRIITDTQHANTLVGTGGVMLGMGIDNGINFGVSRGDNLYMNYNPVSGAARTPSSLVWCDGKSKGGHGNIYASKFLADQGFLNKAGTVGIIPAGSAELNFKSVTKDIYLNHRTIGTNVTDVHIGNGDSDITTHGNLHCAQLVADEGVHMYGGSLYIYDDNVIQWSRNTDYAKMGFKNTSDDDIDTFMYFETGDNITEYFKWRHSAGSIYDWMSLKSSGLEVTGTVTSASDSRVKRNIRKIPDALAKVHKINGYTYDRTDMTCCRQTGLIAQELKEVLPEAVVTSNRSDLNIEDFQSIAYGNVIGLIVEAIKAIDKKYEVLFNKLLHRKNKSN